MPCNTLKEIPPSKYLTKTRTKKVPSKVTISAVKKSSETQVKEEMVAYEVVYEPDTKDAHGEWMSTETVFKACENFNKNLELGNVKPNLFHLVNTDLFSIEKSWIQQEMDVVVEATNQPIKDRKSVV